MLLRMETLAPHIEDASGNPPSAVAPARVANGPPLELGIAVREENRVDYDLTARLATQAFASPNVQFDPDRIRWLYEESFGGGTIVVSAFDTETKVGQVALVGQTLCIDGATAPAVQLVDLFVIESHRSSHLVRRLYNEVEQICRARRIRYILALPNEKSVRLNARLLKLSMLLSLPARGGLALLWPITSRVTHSGLFRELTREHATELFANYLQEIPNGVRWDSKTLFARLSDPSTSYGIHTTDAALLVSTMRRVRGVPTTVLCAFFAGGGEVSRRDMSHLIRSACRLWSTPVFVFAGINAQLAQLPGIELPERFRKPILVQLRDRNCDPHGVTFRRFQLIDSDFA